MKQTPPHHLTNVDKGLGVFVSEQLHEVVPVSDVPTDEALMHQAAGIIGAQKEQARE
jgi:hypothetical protein